MESNKTIESYSKGAKDYHTKRKQSWIGHNNLDEYIRSASRILDYGCGPGILVSELLGLGFKGQYVGYDPSKGMISEAVSSYQLAVKKFKIEFLSDESFIWEQQNIDTVFMIAVVHHMTKDEIAELYVELKPILTKDARVIMTLWEIGKSKRHEKFRQGDSNVFVVPLRNEDKENIGERVYYDYKPEDVERIITDIEGYTLQEKREIFAGDFSNVLFEFTR